MNCANPGCRNYLLYLRGGSLRLLELEATRSHPHGERFLVVPRTARYFWLCPECSERLVLRRWTEDGLVLEARARGENGPTDRWVVQPRPAVQEDALLHPRAPGARTA